MAVQYNKDTGWGGFILDIYKAKKGIVDVSDEATKFFDKTKNWKKSSLVITDEKKFDSFIKKMNLADESLINFLKDTNYGTKDLASYQQYLKDTGKATSTFANFTKKAGTVLKSFGAALGSMAVNWAISEVIGLVVNGFDHLINAEKYEQQAFENATEAAKKYADQIKETREESEKTSETAEKIAERYAQLAQGVNVNTNENTSLSNDDYAEFLDLNKQLAELFPTLTKGYDENGNAILGLSGGVDTVTESIRKLVEQQERLAKQDLKDNLEKYVNGDEDSEGQLKSIEGQKKKVDELNEEIVAYKKVYDSIVNGKALINPKENDETLNEAFKSIKENAGIDKDWNPSIVPQDDNGNYTINYGNTIELSEGEKIKIKKGYENLLSDLVAENQTAQSELDSKNKELSQQMMIWVSDLDIYKDNASIQTALTNLISGINWSDIGLEDFGGVQSYIQTNILTPLQTVCDDPASKAQVIGALSSLFSIDFSKMSMSEANSQIDKLLNTITTLLFPDLDGNDLQKKIDEYRKNLGFDTYKESNDKLSNSIGSGEKDKNGKKNGIAEDGEEVKQLTNYTKDFNQTQVETWLNATQGAKNATDAIQKYEDAIKANKESLKNKSFKDIWNSLGEGDDDAAKKAQEAKEKVLELAEAGKLTIKEFKDSSIADTLKQAGFSAEEATKKVNALVEETKQLSALRTGITSITSAYDEKKESKDNRVSSNTLSSLYDTLDVEKWTDKSDLKVWEQYKDIASNSASSLKQMKEAQDNLATSFVNSNNFLSNLNESNANYYRNLLNEMGVVNGNRVVQNLLGREKAISAIETQNLTNMTGEEINQLINEKGKTEDARIAMREFALEKVYANGQALDTTADIQQLINLIDAFGETSAAIKRYRDYMNGDYNTTAPGGMNVDYLRKEAEKDATSAIKNLKNKQKIKIKTTGSNKADVKRDSGGGKKDSGAKTKKSKQVIDWIERRLKNLQNTIDYTSSKLQNLFTVESKNSNLDKQIKTTTKLINEYGIAAEKYQQKANKVAEASTKTVKGKKGKKKKVKTKELSKDVISKIKTGKLTKKTKLSSLIKEYGEDTANKIQSYIDYYDKAQEAKKNKQDQIAKKRELQVQKQTNIQEEADKKSALYQAERELAQLKDKNGWIKKEIDSTIESYDAQIKAAEIQKDTAEKDKLIAEKKKALLALYQEEVDNIKGSSEARIQSLENGVVNNNGTRMSYGQKYYQNQVALAESRGNKVNKDWYRQQSSIENQKISEYTSERNQLIKELAKFTEGTTEWYNLQADIQACDDSINEARIAQAENTKAMRELTEKMEQEYDDWFSNLNNEISFISSLASGDMTDSDKGTFTDAGNLAMYSQSLLFQSSNAEKEYWKTQTNKLQKLIDTNASVAQIQAAGFEFNSIEDANDALTSYRQNWQDAIKEEKQAEEEIINLMKERYEAEKDYLQDIVDAKKEALSVEKDLYDYERNIAEKTKNVVTLQKRINSLRGDTSEEGRARLSKLQVELDNAQKDLQDTEYDRYISEQQNMLDNMMSQYEDLITKLQKNTDKILEDGLNDVNTNLGSLTTLFQERAKAYDYQMSTDLSTINQKLNDGSLEIISKNSDIAQLLAGESGASENNVISLLRGMGDSIIKSYDDYKAKQNTPPPTPTNNNGGSGSGSGNGSRGSGSTKQQTQTANGQTTVTPDAMDKIEGTNAKLKKLRDALNSMKGAGFEKYWTKKNGTPKSYINQRIAAEPNYDKIVNGKHLHPQILTEAGLKLLAKKLGVKYPASSGAKTTNLNNYVKEAGFKTGGIAQLIKSNGEDGLMLARNGEGFVAPEHVQDIKELMKVIPDMNKFISSVTETPNIPIARNNQPSNSIGEVLFNIDVNPKDFPDFVSQLQNEKRVQQVFSVAVNDLTQKGKITNNIQRY